MQRAIVIGCSGSGKSTFSRKLSALTGLPLFYLDMIWHKPDRTTVTKEQFDRELDKILVKDRWIMDGNYGRTLERRIQACDTVFLFDLPLEDCLAGVEARIGKPRVDMPWVEQEFDEDFRQWIMGFPEKELPYIYEVIRKYQDTKEVHIFHSRDEADAYLSQLSE
ncbi:MAG: adenylate kinase [Lachnospiraceae bacterium]|jgi:adenylate kinase family enzyme